METEGNDWERGGSGVTLALDLLGRVADDDEEEGSSFGTFFDDREVFGFRLLRGISSESSYRLSTCWL